MKSVLVVLGGGVDKNGNMPLWIHARLKKALGEWNTKNYSYLIATGKGRADHAQTEAEAMKIYFMQNGVPEGKVLVERESTSTIENAYLCRINHLDKIGVKCVTIVTNKFHIERAKSIFEFILGNSYLVKISPSDDRGIPTDSHEILAKADIEQAEFLKEHVFNSIEKGNLPQIKKFIYDPNDRGYKAWSEYKSNSELYKKVTALMT
jgi:uncharacterized SAM-binding protein YcdF (DUF218 family)